MTTGKYFTIYFKSAFLFPDRRSRIRPIFTYTSEESGGFIFVLFQITNLTRKKTKESNCCSVLLVQRRAWNNNFLDSLFITDLFRRSFVIE